MKLQNCSSNDFPPENHQPCSDSGGACVLPRPWELYWWKLPLLAGLTKPGRSKGRIQTNRWSNRWQQGEGSAHRQIKPGVFWLWVTVVLWRTLRLLVHVASINYQMSSRKKNFQSDSTSEWVSSKKYRGRKGSVRTCLHPVFYKQIRE